MSWITRLRNCLSQANLDRELAEEIQFHLDARRRDNLAQGMDGPEARSDAERRFGNRTLLQEQTRDMDIHRWLQTLSQDLRYACRGFVRNPGFTLAAVISLALGIGANSAIFQLLDRIVLRSLPVRNPSGLVIPQGYWDDQAQGFSYPLVREMNARQTVVEGIFGSGGMPIRDFQIDGRAVRELPNGLLATGNYFRLIGTEPQIGRFFTESDDSTSASPVAVLSDRFWRAEFGGQLSALGKTIRVNGIPVTVIGVTRPEFFGERVGSSPDLWMPVSMAAPLGAPGNLQASSIWLQPMARLRRDIPPAQAQAQLNALWDQLRQFSIRVRGTIKLHLAIKPGSQGLDTLQTQFTRPLWLLMGIVALVALIACSNLANLLLARSTARAHEIGVRLALGAGRKRLFRQLLTESLALALVGGGVGLALAELASRELIQLASTGETWQLSTGLDWRIAGFTLLITLGSVLVFGLAPAITSARVELNSALRAGQRTHTARSSTLLATRAFVVAQVSLSLLLVAGASLLVRSFWKLTHQDFGYRTESVLMVPLASNGGGIRDLFGAEQNLALARSFRDVPGVRSAAVGASGLLSASLSIGPGPIALPERTLPDSEDARIVAVTPGYLETMGIAIVRGRSLLEEDTPTAPRVAVISETAARLMFGSADPIGKRFSSGTEFSAAKAFEIAGVMRDIRFGSPREPFGAVIFAPLGQAPMVTSPTLVLRVAGDSASFARVVEQRLREVAPKVKPLRIESIQGRIQSEARRERLLAWLSGSFGALALLLAGVGLYGVIAYAAERRTQEIGIRLSLGASPRQVKALLLKEVLSLLVLGFAIGGAATLLFSRVFGSLLFDLSPHDAPTLAFAALVLTAIAFAAAHIPARRAALLDPTQALRME